MAFAKKSDKPTKKGRRARGTGGLFKVKRKGKVVWLGRKVIGRTRDGKPQYVSRTAETQAEVIAALEAATPPGPNTTVAVWATRWLASLSVRPATMSNYTAAMNLHIVPVLGGFCVADVVPSQVTLLLKSLAKNAAGEGLSPGTLVNVRSAGAACFKAAMLDGLISSNPWSATKRPKVKQKEIHPFTADELKRIIAELADSSAGPIIALMASTGCRIGEACALDVTDWDAKAGTISITKTFNRKFGIGPPKTSRSVRTITVPVRARSAITSAIGKRKDGPLFQTGKGRRFVKQLIQRSLSRCLKRLGLTSRTPHELRHSVATLQIARGIPLPDVAKYLGDTVATLVATYLHPSGRDPGKEMDDILA